MKKLATGKNKIFQKNQEMKTIEIKKLNKTEIKRQKN